MTTEKAKMDESGHTSSGGSTLQPIVRIQVQSPDPGDDNGAKNDGRHTSCNDDAQRGSRSCDRFCRDAAVGANGGSVTAGMDEGEGGDGDGEGGPSAPGPDKGVSSNGPASEANGTSRAGGGVVGGGDSGDVRTGKERTPQDGDDFDAGGVTKPDDDLEGGSVASHDADSGDYMYRTRTGEKPRRWLIDRCDGVSKSRSGFGPGSGPDGEESRPPCRVCWPPIPLKWYPDLLEQNRFCECVGRSGCIDPRNERARRRLLTASLIINAIGLLFLVVASFAITETNFDLLWMFPFTNVWMDLVSGPRAYETPSIFAVGLRAAAHESVMNRDAESADQGILSFGEFCDVHGSDVRAADDNGGNSFGTAKMYAPHVQVFAQEYEKVRDCGSCQETSMKIVPSLFLSMLGYIPNFTTDVLRMWSGYDVNCQKFMACVFSWVSLATAIYTWVNYRKECIDYLPDQPIYLDDQFHVTTIPGDAFLVVRFNYGAGLGQVCLALASLLKVVDIACNMMLPTPAITRDAFEQVEYESKYSGEG